MTKSLFTRKSLVSSVLLVAGATFTQGCLQRDVTPQEPNTSNVFVDQIANDSINEIDLLFVVDNSVSMADKQEILQDAVPQMVQRLISPGCKDGADPVANPDCDREFPPVNDIHIGVITSSLGGHGSASCPRVGAAGEYNDDQGWLVPKKRPGLMDPTGLGFLAWDGPPQDSVALVNAFREHVGGAGETGCGFEATLESWYRFLIDPSPPHEIVKEGDQAVMAKQDGVPIVDGEVLAQRAAFLRPEGLVAIVILTDENDCSAMDGGEYYGNAPFGYLVADQGFNMPVATPQCAENPNHECCFSCMQRAPSGCDASACGPNIPEVDDRANVRCFQNKRRFGIDLLYPTSRYVDALTKTTIIDARDGSEKPNPLLTGVGEHVGKGRATDRVFLAGIVGVPWQDVATPESLADPTRMALLDANALNQVQALPGGGEATRWEIILGKPGIPESDVRCKEGSESACGQQPVPPLDPFMVESISPRAAGQTHPLVPAETINAVGSPTFNNINGTEADHNTTIGSYPDEPQNDDLQYACIFPFDPAEPVDCIGNDTCDCVDEPSRQRPLCKQNAGSAAGTTQYWGKAYPGTRILQVLRDFGENSIVASICPKITTGAPENVNYGYNPAVQAIVDRLAEKLAGKCLPRELSVDTDGLVPCAIVEASAPDRPVLDCSLDGRDKVDPVTLPAVLKALEAEGKCGDQAGTECEDWSLCQVKELATGAGRQDCLYKDLNAGTQAVNGAGFCYIDPAKTDADGNFVAGGDADECIAAGGMECQAGDNPLVRDCPATQKRLLRFVGNDASPTPTPGTTTFVACTGDAASSDGPIPAPPVGSGGSASASAGTGGGGT